MKDADLFNLLIRHHIDHNLVRGIYNEEMIDGRMYFTRKGGRKVPVEVGQENKQDWYNGLILLADGRGIVEYLKDAEVIPPDAPLSFMSISDEGEFSEFVNAVARNDGAAIYDRSTEKGTKLILNNILPRNGTLRDMLPKDYLSEDGSVPFVDKYGWETIGSRSHLAVKISRGLKGEEYHPIDAYLIKHTIYNDMGFGPVIHFSRDKMEMFFFRYAPESEGPFILSPKYKIIGVHKTYKLVGGRFEMLSENIMDLNGNISTNADKSVSPVARLERIL